MPCSATIGCPKERAGSSTMVRFLGSSHQRQVASASKSRSTKEGSTMRLNTCCRTFRSIILPSPDSRNSRPPSLLKRRVEKG